MGYCDAKEGVSSAASGFAGLCGVTGDAPPPGVSISGAPAADALYVDVVKRLQQQQAEQKALGPHSSRSPSVTAGSIGPDRTDVASVAGSSMSVRRMSSVSTRDIGTLGPTQPSSGNAAAAAIAESLAGRFRVRAGSTDRSVAGALRNQYEP